MAQRRARRKPMAEINVVPYIDVTLVLLIIFMITAPLVQTGVDVDLPQADTQTIDLETEPPIIVSIDREGNYYIDVGGNGEEAVSAETILVRVKAALRNNPQVKIYIRGANTVNYGEVVTVMGALQNIGVPSVGLMTRPYDD